MPILQPIQTTIYLNAFQDKTYCFAVESVLTVPGQAGILTISASAGYLLTTTRNKEPRREQIIEHVQQSDGSWLAKGNVTLVATGNSLSNGTVIIQNALAETIVLTVDNMSTSLMKPVQTALAVNQSTLTFAQTSPGKPSFLIVTIARQLTDAPVRLTTNAPEYFQLASDSRPVFLPDLTLTPSSKGTSVHVRYSANKTGFHTGQLTISSEYENQTVALEGRSTGLLSTIRPPAVRRSDWRQSIKKKPVRLLALVVACGLVGAVYINRCQLFPSLCNYPELSQAQIQSGSLPEIPSTTKSVEKASQAEKSNSLNKPLARSIQTPSAELTVKRNLQNEPSEVRSTESEVRQSESRKNLATQNTNEQSNDQTVRPKTITPIEEESDLEKALNKEP